MYDKELVIDLLEKTLIKIRGELQWDNIKSYQI